MFPSPLREFIHQQENELPSGHQTWLAEKSHEINGWFFHGEILDFQKPGFPHRKFQPQGCDHTLGKSHTVMVAAPSANVETKAAK